jgi:2,4-dienoyl-CoA reductase-like NADH-dependent reductase (Old Yellow Enzyme family)
MGEYQPNEAKQAVNHWDGIRVGKLQLEHRIVMSPLTRARCPAGLPSEMIVEYYSQRATKGGLLISEGIHPSVMVSFTRCLRPPCRIIAANVATT